MTAFHEKQFNQYFNEYYSQVYKYILKRILNNEDAEDITMDVFISSYKHFENFDSSKASFATWIYVIANNKLKNYFRDHKIHEEIDETHQVSETFEDTVIEAEYMCGMRQALADALNTLPKIQKDIIIYKYYHNKNASEISLIVGMSPGNVRVQLSRAMVKLKEYFYKNDIKWEF